MLLFLACAEPAPLDCTAARAEAVGLVVDVDCDLPDGSAVATFEADGVSGEAPAQAGPGAARFELVGLPPDTDVAWTVTASDGSVATGNTRTGEAPDDLPMVTVTVDAAGQSDEPFVIGSFYKMAADRSMMAAYRRDGTLAWYLLGARDHNALDFSWSKAAEGLLHNEFHSDMVTDDSFVERTTMGGEVLATVPTPGGHHMFEEHADGTIAYQALDTRLGVDQDGNAAEWVGDAIVEIAPDGTSTTLFSVWDVLTPTWNDFMSRPDFYRGLDWTHGNALFWDEAERRYLLSLGHAGDLIVVDGDDGSARAIYGPDGVLASPPFRYQHDAHWLPPDDPDAGNILLFSTDDAGSAAIEYALDGDQLTEVWRYGLDGASLYLGQAQRLPNGNTFVSGGQLGVLEEVTPDGEVVWRMESSDAWGFAQWRLVGDLYTGE